MIRPNSCHYVVTDLSVSFSFLRFLPTSSNTQMCFMAKSKAGCEKLTETIKQKESKIHILVNNSGVTWGAPYDKFVHIDQ